MIEPAAAVELDDTVFFTSSFWSIDLRIRMSCTNGVRRLVGRESAEEVTCFWAGNAGWFVGLLETPDTTRPRSCANEVDTFIVKTNAARTDRKQNFLI